MTKKILLIEDEEIMVDLLQKKLIEQGYQVEVARDGEEGIMKIKGTMPDLILLDIIMPKKGGFEVLEEKQQDDKIKDIPVIIVSNSGQPVELDRAKELGVNDWLIKTNFNPEEVLEKVKKQIN
jgi:CheY-like chemotaxis protein